MVLKPHTDGAADPILQRMAEEDKVPWYKKPNLRRLYFLLFPTCMGVEMTSGFDSQMINAVQLVDPWKECTDLSPSRTNLHTSWTGRLEQLADNASQTSATPRDP